MEHVYSFNYIFKLMQSFYDSKVNDYMFIKHNNTLYLPEGVIGKVHDESKEEYHLLYYKYSKHQMLEAYQPFLGWIPELYNRFFEEETPEEFVKNAGVYPLMRSSFAQYIRAGKAKRTEDILLNEISYESKKVLESLGNIYKYISSKVKLFVVIENFHLASLSGIKALHRFLSVQFDGNLKVFGTYNESYHVFEYVEKEWHSFIETIEKQNYQFE